MQTKARSLISVPLPLGFERIDEKKIILGGGGALERLVGYDNLLTEKSQAYPARYEKECADFHRFVREAIPQVRKGERLEIRVVGKKKDPSKHLFRFCAYQGQDGTEHRFSVHSSCFGDQKLRNIKKHEQRYNPVEASIAV